jgi:hypothetical protein
VSGRLGKDQLYIQVSIDVLQAEDWYSGNGATQALASTYVGAYGGDVRALERARLCRGVWGSSRGGSKTRTAGVLDEVPATATGRAKGHPRARKALSRSIRVGKVHCDPRTECVRGMVKKFDYASTRGM